MTFGELRREGRSWVLKELAPHATIKLKRWFSRVDVATKTLRLTASPENSAELEWFLERFPLRMTDDVAAELARLAQAHRDRQARVQQALFGDYERPALAMAKPAREYQDQGAEICNRTGGLLVADELGLGKTVTAIALLARRGRLPAVVVVPNNVLEQWARKIEEFLPSAKTYVVRHNPKSEPKRAREKRGSASVILMTYSRLATWADLVEPRTLVLDECQELRHASTQKYRWAQEMRAKASVCMGLSATPIYGYGGEFFNVLGVIQPDALGERAEFLREWCTEGDVRKPKIADPLAFGAWVREQGLMIRRSRRDVGRELPPIVRSVFDVMIDAEDNDNFEALAWAALHAPPKDQFFARGELDHRLRRWTGVAKAPAVAAFVDELLESTDEPVLLSGWHHDVYRIWLDKLARWKPRLYTGLQDSKAKDMAAQAMISGETKLLIMSLRSGQGLDGLQGVCRRVVHGELDWSPQVHQQLTGRIHRDGQGETTMEYWPISEAGSDPVILDTLGVKRWQSDAIVDPEGERLLEVKADPDAMRRLAEDYLRRRGLDPSVPPERT